MLAHRSHSTPFLRRAPPSPQETFGYTARNTVGLLLHASVEMFPNRLERHVHLWNQLAFCYNPRLRPAAVHRLMTTLMTHGCWQALSMVLGFAHRTRMVAIPLIGRLAVGCLPFSPPVLFAGACSVLVQCTSAMEFVAVIFGVSGAEFVDGCDVCFVSVCAHALGVSLLGVTCVQFAVCGRCLNAYLAMYFAWQSPLSPTNSTSYFARPPPRHGTHLRCTSCTHCMPSSGFACVACVDPLAQKMCRTEMDSRQLDFVEDPTLKLDSIRLPCVPEPLDLSILWSVASPLLLC